MFVVAFVAMKMGVALHRIIRKNKRTHSAACPVGISVLAGSDGNEVSSTMLPQVRAHVAEHLGRDHFYKWIRCGKNWRVV